MPRSKSSQAWLERHFKDEYVKRAQREGARSRAAYKLAELDRRDRLFRPGMLVVDLGAAPGGWSEYAARRTAPGGRVSASYELMFLTGWAPHPEQPKPLRPGSASHRLAEALGAVERKPDAE